MTSRRSPQSGVLASTEVEIALSRVPRRLLLATLVSAIVVFCGLMIVVSMNGLGPLSLDTSALMWVEGHRSAVVVNGARALTDLGGSGVLAAVMAVSSAGAAFKARDFRWFGAGVGLLATGMTLRFMVAEVIARPRPPLTSRVAAASGFAFPSGHTTGAVLGWGLASLPLWSTADGTGRVRLVAHVVVPASVAVIVGITRVALGVHWLTDILAGWALGISLLAGSALLLPRLVRPRQGTSEHSRAPG